MPSGQDTEPSANGHSRPVHLAIASLLVLASILLLALLPIIDSPFSSHAFYGRPFVMKAPDFALSDTEGSVVHLSDFRGQFVYLMFGYLGCERVCHAEALTLYMLSRRLHDERVRFLFLGMDPKRDSPEKIRQYFDARGTGFTGLVAADMAQAQRIAADYHAYFSPEPTLDGSSYRIDHPGFIYLIDPGGKIRLIYTGTALSLDGMLDDFDQLSRAFNNALSDHDGEQIHGYSRHLEE